MNKFDKGVSPPQRDLAKGVTTLIGVIIIIAVAVILFGGVFFCQHFLIKANSQQQNQNHQQQTIEQQTNTPSESGQNNNSRNNKSSNQPMPEIIGGACSYFAIDGSCKIVSVIKTLESEQQKLTTGYEGFDVEFAFTPKSSTVITEDMQRILTSQRSPHSLRLTNFWYPGPLYLVKYNIKENNIFDCHALIISKGTCSPVIFEFSKIDLSDYFETKS